MTKKTAIRVREIVINLTILLAALSISLFVIEIIFRLIPATITNIDFSSRDDIRIFSPTRGYEYKPNSERDFNGLGTPVVWHFNNFGFRDRSFSVEKSNGKVFRIAFLGDSMVMGLGVEDYEALPRQLEKALQPKEYSSGAQLFEIYNMGLWGSTAAQTYLAITKEIVPQLSPDLLILGWFSSDSGESGANERDKKYNTLRAIPDSFVPYKLGEFLKKRSYLYNFILGRYYHLVEATKAELPENSILISEGWGVADRDLGEIKRLTDGAGIKFLLVGIPNIEEIANPNIKLYRDREERLEEISMKHGIEYIDLKPFLLKHRNFRDYYIDGVDTHFNILGNKLVADFLADYLAKSRLIPVN